MIHGLYTARRGTVGADGLFGGQGGVTLFLVVPITSDAAASNVLLFAFLVKYFARMNLGIGRQVGLVVLLTLTFCQAHQIHISARTALAGLGATLAEGKKFVSGLIGTAHTFGNGSHLIRIYAQAVHVVGSTKMMTEQQASEADITIASDQDYLDKVALLSWLMRWVLQVRRLPAKIVVGIETLCKFWNCSLMHWRDGDPTHIHVQDCTCSMTAVLVALGVIYNRLVAVFSEGRWGSSGPSTAMVAVWLLPYRLGKRAVTNAYDESKLTKLVPKKAATKDDVVGGNLDSENEFREKVQTRVGRTVAFMCDERTLFRSFTCTTSLELEHECLFLTFKRESRRSPEVARLAKRSQGLECSANHDPDEDKEPITVTLARGDKILSLIVKACEMFTPAADADRLRPHIAASRRFFGNAPADIRETWNSAIPGMAQVWFRLYLTWKRFPYLASLIRDLAAHA